MPTSKRELIVPDEARKAEFQSRLHEQRETDRRLQPANPPPKYDDVFLEGTEALDRLAGDPIESREGEAVLDTGEQPGETVDQGPFSLEAVEAGVAAATMSLYAREVIRLLIRRVRVLEAEVERLTAQNETLGDNLRITREILQRQTR